MAEITVQIRARLLARFRATVVLLLDASAESLHLTLSALEGDPRAIEEARLHLRRLGELGALLDQIGWSEARQARHVEVESSWEVLHDAALGTLLDAGETLAADVEAEPASAREQAEDVLALDRLLKRIDREL
jgi:hypothetical protein